jgi:uncharacterized protein YceH (UPF0502 family)
MTALNLTLLQTRVLGVLVEKARTVPDTYPLSLNALTAGCNQKNNRDPVLAASEAEVQAAVDALRARTLVIESSGARVRRYAHNLGRVLKVPAQSEALLATLFLRGPQTAGELRIGAERLHRFADLSSVEAFLEELATRPQAEGGALVVKLPRRAGERESRWAHLLSGAVSEAAAPTGPPGAAAAEPATELARLQREIDGLRAELAELRRQVAALAGAPRAP